MTLTFSFKDSILHSICQYFNGLVKYECTTLLSHTVNHYHYSLRSFFVRVARIGFASRLASSARASHRLVARSADLAHSAVRFSLHRHNDAPLTGLTCLFADHCAGSENRTRVSTLGRSHSATRPYPHCILHMSDICYLHISSGLQTDKL